MLDRIFSALWWTKEGWYLYYGNHGFEWLPSPPLLNLMIDRGEIG